MNYYAYVIIMHITFYAYAIIIRITHYVYLIIILNYLSFIMLQVLFRIASLYILNEL